MDSSRCSSRCRLGGAATVLTFHLLAACGTGGQLVGEDQVARIEIGRSTKQEVRRLLGEPRTVSVSNVVGERGETWIYPVAARASDPATGMPPIGVEGFPISRAQRDTTQVEISFDEKDIVSSLIETSPLPLSEPVP